MVVWADGGQITMEHLGALSMTMEYRDFCLSHKIHWKIRNKLGRGTYLYEFTTTIRIDEASSSLFESDDDIIQCVNLLYYRGIGFGERCELRRDGRFVPVRETKPEHRRRWQRMLSSVADTTQTAASVLAETSSFFPPVAAAAKGVQMVFSIKDKVKSHRIEARYEIERAAKLCKAVDEFMQSSSQNRSEFPMQDARTITLRCDEIQQNLEPISDSSLGSRILRLNRNKDTIQDCRRHLDLVERDFKALRDSYSDRRIESLQANVIQVKWLCSCIAISIAYF
ncbi:hypothetical protein D9756_011044 [Leucocoprinus leucothites]|uniref:Uncharacterized protein n=1 Tax=Leucocoprinus leucothites TaxID=201217 RepID=A0A8H5CR86_9AGAR|nr:hypothetical protein D9756_011044 [Leucoagaricus leucothites]